MRLIILIAIFMALTPGIVVAERTITLSTINWEPYSGQNLPNHGFFSELVTEAFSRVGYRVKFQYRPWSRALMEAKAGDVHGVMDVYRQQDREQFLDFSDVVWKVREDFIVLQGRPSTNSGKLKDLKGATIGVLRGSLQARELQAAGLHIVSVNNQVQNVKMLFSRRVDVMLAPSSLFFYHARRLELLTDRTPVEILTPPYKVYAMYVGFSKKMPDHAIVTADFNRGLYRIKMDRSYHKILQKHRVPFEE